MKELADGLLRWTEPHPEWSAGDFGAEVASFAVRAAEEGLLIDPLLASSDSSAVDDLFAGASRVSILITIGYHARRCCRAGARRWSARSTPTPGITTADRAPAAAGRRAQLSRFRKPPAPNVSAPACRTRAARSESEVTTVRA